MKYLKTYENNSKYEKTNFVQIDINDKDEVMLIIGVVPLNETVNQYEGMIMPSMEIEFVTEHNIIKKLTKDEVNFLLNVNKYNL